MIYISPENINIINASFEKRLDGFPLEWQNEIKNAFTYYNDDEKICMQFLLAFMPDQDVCFYTLSVLEKYVRFSLDIREKTPWGKDIQDDLFLNYVLQYRVNNEDVDFCLDSFSEELLPRIQGLDMKSAAIEVNYWCYEKAIYQSTDLRTISPKSIVKRTYGRCGEESSFFATALRSVCIPARQVYTPRWAHCDDNHAWVELYADGKWHFTGACEPEPILDSGWFMVPASRAMLIHSKVFSTLATTEKYTVKTSNSIEFNVLNHYAKTRDVEIKVVDKENNAVEGASVHIKVVNFAEMYSITILKSNADGIASITVGEGDFIVYCCYNGLYGFAKVFAADNNVTVTLGERERQNILGLSIIPPVGADFDDKQLDNEAKRLYEEKMKHHESKREDYINTFFTKESAYEWASKLPEFSEFKDDISQFLYDAKGNHKEITDFLTLCEPSLDSEIRVRVLKCLASKDIVDITCQMLVSFSKHSLEYRNKYEKDIFYDYILNPRIEYEMITDYRNAVADLFTAEEKSSFRKSPREIYDYILKNISDSEESRYSIFYSSPIGALRYKKANGITKRMLFVAICRSLGIPSKIEKKDRSLCFYIDGKWYTIEENKQQVDKGKLLLIRDESQHTLEYMKDFTVGMFKNSDYETLDLRNFSWEGNRLSLDLDTGDYRIITANRNSDGSLLCNVYYTDVTKDSTTEQEISLYISDKYETRVQLCDFTVECNERVPLSSLLTGEKNVLAYIGAGEEPTEHLFNELIEAESRLKTLEVPFVFFVESAKALENKSFKRALECFSNTNVKIIVTPMQNIIDGIFSKTKTQDSKLPLIAVINNDREVFDAWSGYNVGIVSFILKKL